METVDIDLYMAQISRRKNELFVLEKDGVQFCAIAKCGSTFWSEIGRKRMIFSSDFRKNIVWRTM